MLSRREFLRLSLLCGLAACAPRRRAFVRFALLHLAPRAGDLQGNWEQIETGTAQAAALGADWVLTPELASSGYEFADVLGLDWIQPQPDAHVQRFCSAVRRMGVNVFLGTPDYDPVEMKHYNSMLVIGRDGRLLGSHRKVKVVQVQDEAWSTPGTGASTLDVDGVSAGVLICADAYEDDLARENRRQGAGVLVSGACWAPGECSPDEYWKARTRETGLSLLVCNRTGREVSLDFRRAQSVIVRRGAFSMTYAGETPAVLSADLETGSFRPLSTAFEVTHL